jgi:prephenate dehydratase
MMNIAFLGPEASFTQLVSLQAFPNENLQPQASILDCFKAVGQGLVDKAVVPLENSIEGTVSMTLDYLFETEGLCIEAEIIMPIAHHLVCHPNNSHFEKVFSHPQALAQCYHFIHSRYPQATRHDYASTAAAAKMVSEHQNEPWAAIANAYAAKRYGLKILHHNIQDFEENHTRFIVISKQKTDDHFAHLPEIGEKSGLLITLPTDCAGGLHQVLSAFAWRKLNLSKIESRTLKTGLGNYFFFINISDAWHPVLSPGAIDEIEALGCKVKFLGHYPEYLLEA